MPPHLTLVSSTARPERHARLEKPREAPTHMTAEGKRAWSHLVPIAARKTTIGPQDVIALERLCESYGDIIRATDSLSRPFVLTQQGEAIELAPAGSRFYETRGRSGVKRRERPECATIRRAERLLRGYLAEFGLVPADIAGGPKVNARTRNASTTENMPRESSFHLPSTSEKP